jgi:FKBP-type peptidyl-prolyl cis-trans isomerase SlyD
MLIAANSVVSFHYRVTLDDGTPVDSSEGDEALTYLHGHGQIVDGLEAALLGKQSGDHVDARLEPAEAYGEYDDELDLEVPLDAFPEDARAELQTGAQFAADHPTREGEPIVFTVIELRGEELAITGNHPLAGKTLRYSVDVVEVRAATEQELAHGHAHGAHGHDH